MQGQQNIKFWMCKYTGDGLAYKGICFCLAGTQPLIPTFIETDSLLVEPTVRNQIV